MGCADIVFLPLPRRNKPAIAVELWIIKITITEIVFD